jgi:hypothetical protein
VLIGAAIALLALAGVACGGDDTSPHLNQGPADDVHGVWQGTYMAADGSQSGTFCVNLEQDDRGLTGAMAFNGGAGTEVGGIINQSSIILTWGPALDPSATPPTATDISVGGTLNGTNNGGTASGTWIAAASVDVHGDWTASHTDAENCG